MIILIRILFAVYSVHGPSILLYVNKGDHILFDVHNVCSPSILCMMI